MKNRSIYLCITLVLLFIIVLYQPVFSSSGPVILKYSKSYRVNIPPFSITNITICNNQLPYNWNGITCLNAGTYTAILIAGNGSDSSAILNLSVINIGISITNAVICDNQLPYTWNGNSYSGSGTYSVTLTSSNGCDSVPILSLTVNHIVSSITNISICSNLLPYGWNGNSYAAAGSYNITLTSAAGCDSIATLQLAVRPVSASITNKTICASLLPFNWNGNTYPTAGTYQVSLTGSNGCDSLATLNLLTIPTSTSFTAITVCSNQLPYSWNGQVYILAGNHSVTLTAASGCDSIATLLLTVKPVLQSHTNITICNGQLPYLWNGNNYPAGGNYSVTLTGSGGCDSIATLHLIAVPVLTTTNNVTVCNIELPYLWNGNSYSLAGSYTSSFINSAGCDSIATLVLTIDTAQFVNSDTTLCEGQLPFTWHGYIFTAPGTYPINPPIFIDSCHSISSFTITVDSLHSYNAFTICNDHLPYVWHGISYNSSGTYIINLPSSTGGCDTLATLDLSIHQVSSSSTNTSICSNQLPYGWNGQYYNSSGTYIVILSNSQGCDSIATLILIVNPVWDGTTNKIICPAQLPYLWNGNTYTSSGIYTVTLISSSGCDSIATLNLGIQPFLTSTTNLAICNNQLPYSWNGNNYPVAGIYSVTLLSSSGCDSVATLNLSVNNVRTGDTILHICNTQLPYTWNGHTYISAGTYTVSLISAGGCDSAATLHLVVHIAVSSNTMITICNNQLPYSWNGNSYPVTGIFPVTLTSSSGCDSVATLHLVVTDILTSTSNVTVCNAQMPYQWNGISYAVAGTYSVTIASPGGCDSVPILSLTVVNFVTSNTNVLICSNQLPYSWNGYSYTTAGTFTATLINSSGCDSIATLNLLVKPVSTSISNKTTCSNHLPFNWNGNSYNAPGIYSATLTGINGCDSIASLGLVVNPVSSSSTDISLCSYQLPYHWNGYSYSSAGIYTVTLTGSAGCDSIASLALHVKQVTYSSTNSITCSNQLPYSWNGQQFTTAGPHTVTLVNAAGCDSVATLHLTVNPVKTSSSNASVCDNQLPFNWNGHSYITTGIYTVILVSSAGCDSLASLNLSINPVTTSLTQVNTCSNLLPFSWNGQSYTTAGNYTIMLTSVMGCDSLATLKLTVNPVTTSITHTVTCSGLLPYNWNGHSYSTPGIFTVILVNSTGCDSVATLDLSIQSSPSLPMVNSPVLYCQYDPTIALAATLTDTLGHLVWYSSAAGGTGSLTAPLPSSSSAGSTNYFVSQVNGSCESLRALITVTVKGKPALGPDRLLNICFGAIANLSVFYPAPGNLVSWTHNGSPAPEPVAATIAGSYQVVAINSSGCSDTAAIILFIQPPVVAHAGNDANVETNIPYQLTGSGGGEYQWSPAGSLNDPFIANPLATIAANTSFILMVKDKIGCTAFDTLNLRVLNGPTFYVPTAFTPNSDGLNDIFRPSVVGISSLDYFRVYNRYGELVYETSEIGKGWDGVYRGIKQNTGNYVWWVKGTDRKGQEKLLRGNVVLIR